MKNSIFKLFENGGTYNSLLCIWTGVNEISPTSNMISVFPDPADDYIVVKGIPEGKSKIQIIGVTGELLVESYHHLADPEAEINIPLESRITSGLYFLRIIQSDGKFTNLKFIKL